MLLKTASMGRSGGIIGAIVCSASFSFVVTEFVRKLTAPSPERLRRQAYDAELRSKERKLAELCAKYNLDPEVDELTLIRTRKKLAIKYHPDKHPNVSDEKRAVFQELFMTANDDLQAMIEMRRSLLAATGSHEKKGDPRMIWLSNRI